MSGRTPGGEGAGWTGPGRAAAEVEGVPDFLDEDVLRAVIDSEGLAPATAVSHAPLSSHKEHKLADPRVGAYRSGLAGRGTYRVTAELSDGSRWSVICKNDPRPAGMPSDLQRWVFGDVRSPGAVPPEARILGGDAEELRPWVPRGHACLELRPGEHWVYLIEDIVGGTPARAAASVIELAGRLPRLHEALDAWVRRTGTDGLGHADADEQALTNGIDAAARTSPNEVVGLVHDVWHRLLDAKASAADDALSGTVPIHGDLNVTNVLVDPRSDGRFVVIDWETARLGRTHDDLAQLLMDARPMTEYRGVSAYARAAPARSPAQHWRHYRFSRLEYLVTTAIGGIEVSEDLDAIELDDLSPYAALALRQAASDRELGLCS